MANGSKGRFGAAAVVGFIACALVLAAVVAELYIHLHGWRWR